jgi:hypothetical protein
MGIKTRVAGGYTVLHWEGKILAWADTVATTSVRPVTDAVAVQPMNYLQPAEIVTPRAHTYGTITLTLTELANEPVWQRLAGGSPSADSVYATSRDIMDIFQRQAALNTGIMATLYKHDPNSLDASGHATVKYKEDFFNVTLVTLDDDENVRIDTVLLNKTLTFWYTNSQKHFPNTDTSSRPAFIQ